MEESVGVGVGVVDSRCSSTSFSMRLYHLYS